MPHDNLAVSFATELEQSCGTELGPSLLSEGPGGLYDPPTSQTDNLLQYTFYPSAHLPVNRL